MAGRAMPILIYNARAAKPPLTHHPFGGASPTYHSTWKVEAEGLSSRASIARLYYIETLSQSEEKYCERNNTSQTWWSIPIIPVLERQRQEYHQKFKGSQGTCRLCLKKITTKRGSKAVSLPAAWPLITTAKQGRSCGHYIQFAS